MTHNHKNRRFDDAESRSKAELLSEIDLSQEVSGKSAAHLLHELQVHQTELEMQNHEIREAQRALEESRDRYALLYDFAPVGYLTLDETGVILEINLTGAAMLGLERANTLGKPFATCLAKGDSHAFFHHLSQTFHSAGNTVAVLKIKNREGEMIYVRLESSAMNGGIRACRTVMTNISEHKCAAMALQQARSEQETLLQAIPAFVFYKDLSLRYVAVSRMLADFLGRQVADVLGKTDFDLLPRELAEDFQRIYREVLESGKPRTGLESRNADLAGNRVHISTVLAPFFNAEGEVAGLLGVGIDVTRLKEAARLNQELMQQNRALTQNLYSIQENERHHLARELHDELGQWLTAIHAEAQAIEGMLDRDHKIAESVRAINSNANEMHHVIRNMLHKLRPPLLDELGLGDSLRELVDQWRSSHPGIACDLSLEGNINGFGETTSITAYRIVQEALTNIAKHAHADRASVRLHREPGEIPGSDALLLCLEDNGKGFDPDQACKGFGLLGMRERVIAAGGEYSLRNIPDQGVCIDVRLPLNCQIERRKK